MTFKSEHTLEKRKEVAERILKNYQDRLPVIVEKAPKSDAPDIAKQKFLVPKDITAGKFVCEVRKHMKLEPEKGIFLFVKNGVLPPANEQMSSIYDKYKDEDGFLYISYNGENTFGSF